MDIYGEDRFFYIASLFDVYDRNVLEYHMGLFCKEEDTITLKRALIRRGLYYKKPTWS